MLVMSERRAAEKPPLPKEARPRAHSNRRFLWGLFALLMICTGAQAQQFGFRPYTPTEGLTNLAVGHLALGATGDLWVGTDGGLFRYDGTAFEPIDTASGLPPDQVGGIQTDRWGGVWVNLVRGLYTRPPGSSRFEAVSVPGGDARVDFRTPVAILDANRILAISSGQIIQLQRDRDHWVSKAYLDPGQTVQLARLGAVRRLWLDSEGTLWLSCGRQICSISDNTVREWHAVDGVAEDDWNSYLEDRDGRLWVRSPQHLLVRERTSKTFMLRDPPQPELGEMRDDLAMMLDPDGRVLVRTGAGLARWDNGHWKQFTFANGLPAASISTIQLDAEGNIWLGMNGLGLWRWRNYDRLESWTRTQGLVSDKIWSLLRDPDGRLLLGTSNGCQMLDEQTGRAVACPVEGLPRRALRAIVVDGTKALWWGFTNGEIWKSRRGEARAHLVFAADANRPEISTMYFDRSGLGWVAALDGGLFQFDPQSTHLEKVALPGGRTRICDMAEDSRGRLWVSGSKGLFRREKDSWTLSRARDPAGTITVFDSVAGTPDGYIWGASDGRGLLRAPSSDFERREWVQAEIVAHTSVYFVRTDSRGWIWLGTDQGVIVFDGHIWRRLDQEDGLVWNDTQVYGFLADGDGSVWIGTSAGLTHIRDPEHLMSAPRPLELNIASARLGTELLEATKISKLPWRSDSAFDVHLSSHSFSRSAQTEFRYRLIGLSSNWFGSRSPEIHVPALNAGKYTLEVMAVDAPHARQSRTLALTFEILPPWWRTLTFRLAVVALALTLVALAWRWQIVKLRARRSALEAEFQERQALLERATRDALTGLWNRATILDALTREMNQAQRTGQPLAVGLIDVDHFKLVNDNYGHLCGDEVLRTLARRLTAMVRQGDWLGRYGGEELMMVMAARDRGELEAVAERLRKCVADVPFVLNGQPLTVTVSIGIAQCTSTDGPESVIARADAALYDAKRGGRNRVSFVTAVNEAEMTPTGSHRYLRALLEKINGQNDEPARSRAGRNS